MRAFTAFLSASLIACLCTGASAAVPAVGHKGSFVRPPVRASRLTTLYDQTGHDSAIAIVSQNFEDDFDVYDAAVADDFTVPDGRKWKLKEIDVPGTYFDGTGPARSLNIAIFKNKGDLPGKLVAEYDAIEIFSDGQGSFVVRLPKWLKLKPGRYWISVQANMDFSGGGEWGWETASIMVDNPAQFQNPGDGFATGCTTWMPVATCVPNGEGDMLFALRGKEE